MHDLASGTLYLVATPIGNLEDITFRAVRILKEADLIACEDTRQTRKLLDHYGIAKPAVSYHEHNEARAQPGTGRQTARRRQRGAGSDAGMPLISDPGYRLVRAAIDNGIRVEAVPGASALSPRWRHPAWPPTVSISADSCRPNPASGCARWRPSKTRPLR